MPRHSDGDYDFGARPVRGARRRKRGTKLALPLEVVLALGLAGLLVLLAFVIRGSAPAVAWAGLAVCILANLWFLCVAASDSVGQLLLCLFIPFYSLFYLIVNWGETKWLFGLNVLGLFVIVGSLIAGAVREGISRKAPDKPALAGAGNAGEQAPPQSPSSKEAPRPASSDSNDPTSPAPPFDVDPDAKSAGKTVYLAALQPFAYGGGPWPYAVGMTGLNSEAPIKVQGREYKYGISACPPNSTAESCRVSFSPGAEFRRLKGAGALNDYAANPWGKVVFIVRGDGKKLWESEPLDKSGSATEFDMDVTGVKVLTLETRVKEGSHLHAHAVWLDPWLER